MNSEQLLAHFDRMADATDAIPRLRRFVLDLAVRGKLLEQDPADEPASVLLKKIAAEKARLAGDGVIKGSDPARPRDAGAGPYAIPTGWRWAAFAEVAIIQSNLVDPKDYQDSPHIAPDNIESRTGKLLPYETIREAAVFSAKHLFSTGCILYSKIRPALAKAVIVDFEGLCSADMYPIRPFIDRRFLHWYMLSEAFVEQSVSEDTRVAMPKINQAALSKIQVPVPPLVEQRNIVAKVDELMALCDRLESAQAERESQRDRLVAASLQRLNQPAEDAAAFRDHARFALDNLPRLATRPEHITQLRQTILNLAVRGKLVPQDPKDEPAPSYATVESADSRGRLVMSLPRGWSWARVDDVAESRLGKMLDKAKNSGKAYRYLRNTNVHWFDIRLDELKTMRIENSEIASFLLQKGDVLICEGGHGIGRTAVWRANESDIVFQKALHRVRPGTSLDSDFFAQCVFVYFHAGVLQRYYTGVGIPHFTGVALAKLVFPLPPLVEQHRIVAKVDELMIICDQLEAQLTTAQTESGRLLDAVLHQALVSESEREVPAQS